MMDKLSKKYTKIIDFYLFINLPYLEMKMLADTKMVPGTKWNTKL